MYHIKALTIHRINIQKSEFIALLYPLDDAKDVSNCVEDAKKRYPKANHYCRASIRGSDGASMTSNDDGEPHRTAGVPMLEVLKHHDVTDICAVVVRYFGGIKLGAGGLVRAYTKAISEALEKTDLYIKHWVPSVKITFDYGLLDTVDRLCKDHVDVLEKTFLETVCYHLVFKDGKTNVFDDIRHQLIAYEALPDVILYEKA